MRSFLRSVRPLLGVRSRRVLLSCSAGSVVVAGLDAFGVLLILPLVRLLPELQTSASPTDVLTWLPDRFSHWSLNRLAVVLALLIFGTFILKTGLAALLLMSTLRNALASEVETAGNLLRGYLQAPLEYLVDRNSAQMQQTLHDSLRRVFQEALPTSVVAMGDCAVIGLIGFVLLVLAPIEALVGIVLVGLLAVAYRQMGVRRMRASSDDLMEQSQRSIAQIQQVLGAVREIRLTGRGQNLVDELLSIRERAARRQRSLTLTELLPRYYLELGVVVSVGVIAGVAFSTRGDTEAAVAVLAVFLAAGLRVLPSLNRVVVATAKAHVAMPHVGRIHDDLSLLADDAALSAQDSVEPGQRSQTMGRFELLSLIGVGFSYRSARSPTLIDVTLEVARGEFVALAGASGGGKTTLVNLVLGLLEPTAGSIQVNGLPLERVRSMWQRRIGYVPQEVMLLDAPIRSNVALAVPPSDIDDERVRRALDRAGLLTDVDEMVGDITAEVGERGARLSGGQRQRLGLARALYDDPEFLVLDEATSALDVVTERTVLDTLERLRESVTILFVTHRASTLDRSDRVLRVADGCVSPDSP
ncbi:MAG: ABC transporter ATP-binding protein [Microthrixaceae bacterium]